MTAESVLKFNSRIFVNFRDFDFDQDGHHGFRWVNCKKYVARRPGASDTEILRALIESTAYRDTTSVAA